MSRLASVLLLALLCGSAFAGEPKIGFDIAAGNAPEKINEFALRVSHELGMQVVFRYDLLQPYQTNPVRGTYNALEALRLMIKDTGIEFSVLDRKTLTLQPTGYEPDGPSVRKDRIAREDLRKKVLRYERDEIEREVVVTGSNFTEVSTGSDIITISREELETSGGMTTADIARTLPQAFGGGPTEDTQRGREAPTNTGRGVGINLRGLGAGATLPLVNGKRLAPSGSDGVFSDVLSIPFIALDRMDVLADGTSALYGSDAVGGVVNFVLRNEFEGAETHIDLGSVTSGSTQEYRVGQLFGKRWDGGRLLIAVEKYDRDALAAADRAQAQSDLREFGGTNFDSPSSSPGNVLVGNQIRAIRPDGNGGFQLVPGEQNLQNRFKGADVMPSQDHRSVFATGRHQLTDRLKVNLDALYAERKAFQRSAATTSQLQVPANHPDYVDLTGVGLGLPMVVLYSFFDDLGPQTVDVTTKTGNFALGADLEFGSDWMLSASLGYTFERQRQTLGELVNASQLNDALAGRLPLHPGIFFDPFSASGANEILLDEIRTEAHLSTDSKLRSGSLAVRGPLATLPGGPLRLAFGAEHRTQVLDTNFDSGGAQETPDPVRDLDRDVAAVFTEILVPIVGPDNRLPGITRLQLSALARYEHYTDFGGTTTPRFGLLWSPIDALSLRGTWAKSFRAPNLSDLFEGKSDNFSTLFPLIDPASPGGFGMALVRFGNNPELHEETADSWTAGFDFAPEHVPGLSFGATYFDIEFRERIREPAFAANALLDPGLADLIDRNPTAEERADICANTFFSNGPLNACLNTPIVAIYDIRLRNMALLHTRGVDLATEYRFDTRWGKFKLGALATYIIDFEEQEAASSPLVERVDTQNNPIDFRMRASLRWQYRDFEATAFLNYADGYADTVSIPARRVREMTTADLDLAYTTPEATGGWLENTRFALHVDNVWDRDVPFLNNPIGLGYDQENADLMGRVIRIGVQKTW